MKTWLDEPSRDQEEQGRARKRKILDVEFLTIRKPSSASDRIVSNAVDLPSWHLLPYQIGCHDAFWPLQCLQQRSSIAAND